MEQSQQRRWLSTDDLAKRFGVSPSAVRGWRHRGVGPTGRRFGGSVRYSLDDIEAWEQAQPTTQSTPAA